MIPETTLYLYAAGVFAVATLGFTVAAARLDGGARRGILAVVVACGLSTASYLAMWAGVGVLQPGDSPVYLTRFLEYWISFPALFVVACLVVGASRRAIAGLLVVMSLFVGAMVGAQLADGPVAVGMFLVGVLSLVAVAAGTFGPIWERARQASDDRRLLFWKLRNLLVLLLGVSLGLGLLTRQVLGVFDAFVGILIATYLDVLVRVGFGFLFLRGAAALDGSPTIRPPPASEELESGSTQPDAPAVADAAIADAAASNDD